MRPVTDLAEYRRRRQQEKYTLSAAERLKSYCPLAGLSRPERSDGHDLKIKAVRAATERMYMYLRGTGDGIETVDERETVTSSGVSAQITLSAYDTGFTIPGEPPRTDYGVIIFADIDAQPLDKGTCYVITRFRPGWRRSENEWERPSVSPAPLASVSSYDEQGRIDVYSPLFAIDCSSPQDFVRALGRNRDDLSSIVRRHFLDLPLLINPLLDRIEGEMLEDDE